MIKLFRRLFSLLLFFIIIIGTLTFLVDSNYGLQISYKIAQEFIPGNLQIAKLQGTLLSKVTIDNLSYQDQYATSKIKHITFSWSAADLLRGEIKIKTLDIDSPAIRIKPNQAQHSNQQKIALPFTVQINHLSIKQLQFFKDKQSYEIESIDLQGTATENYLALNKLQILTKDYQLSAHGKFDWQHLTDTNMHIDANNITKNVPPLTAVINVDLTKKAASNIMISTTDIHYKDTVIQSLNVKANGDANNQSMQIQINTDKGDLLAQLSGQTKTNQWQGIINQLIIKRKNLKYSLIKNMNVLFQKHQIRWLSFCLSAPQQSICSQGNIDFSKSTLESWQQAKLQAQVNVILNNLNLLDTLNQQFRNTNGQAIGQINLTGALAHPQFSGDVTLKNAHTSLARLGITLQIANMQAHATKMHSIDYSATINSGKGFITLKGNASLQGNTYQTNTAIKGQNFTLMNTDDYQVIASPNLQLKTLGKNINLTGTIDIPNATLAPKDFSQTVELPDDVVFVPPRQQQDLIPWAINSNIHISLGNQVNIKLFGIAGQLAGGINIQDHPQQITTGVGQLHIVNGKYNAYGQQLTIDRGEMLFSGGPVVNPGLNIRASRKITLYSSDQAVLPLLTQISSTTRISNTQTISQEQQLNVGVQVQGQLRKPRISLFSIPANYTQADILSYLLLGRPVASASKADSQLLLRAVSALNIGDRNAGQITDQIQHALGLDVLSVVSEPQYDAQSKTYVDGSAVVLGKALSSRLFINYTFGLLQDLNVVRIRYLLSKQWILQSETDGNANGFDVFYKIERP